MDWEELMTNFEIGYTNQWTNCFDRITGFFEAPVDGTYQFHMSCDDNCQLYLSTSDPMDPSEDSTDAIINRDGWYTFRDFGTHNWNNDPDAEDTNVGNVFSDWITLTGGEKYYIEAHSK